jgi:hypothetical protein
MLIKQEFFLRARSTSTAGQAQNAQLGPNNRANTLVLRHYRGFFDSSPQGRAGDEAIRGIKQYRHCEEPTTHFRATAGCA